jgi:fermentation-respiration switch protein FrsA (DUF1100 family)
MRAQRSDLVWKVGVLIAGAAAATLATRLVGVAWKKATGGDVPTNLVAGQTSRTREVIWVVASGVAVALLRLVARRGLARVWRAKTGHYPRPLVESSPGAIPEPA